MQVNPIKEKSLQEIDVTLVDCATDGCKHTLPLVFLSCKQVQNAFYAVDKKAKSSVAGYNPELIVATNKEAAALEIQLKDNSDGIPAHVKDKIFQPLLTTKPTDQGTGLGLSLSYDTIKAHGGALTVETKDRKGSDFIIKLSTAI